MYVWVWVLEKVVRPHSQYMFLWILRLVQEVA